MQQQICGYFFPLSLPVICHSWPKPEEIETVPAAGLEHRFRPLFLTNPCPWTAAYTQLEKYLSEDKLNYLIWNMNWVLIEKAFPPLRQLQKSQDWLFRSIKGKSQHEIQFKFCHHTNPIHIKKKVSELIKYKGKSLHADTEEATHKQVLGHSICLPAIPQK